MPRPLPLAWSVSLPLALWPLRTPSRAQPSCLSSAAARRAWAARRRPKDSCLTTGACQSLRSRTWGLLPSEARALGRLADEEARREYQALNTSQTAPPEALPAPPAPSFFAVRLLGPEWSTGAELGPGLKTEDAPPIDGPAPSPCPWKRSEGWCNSSVPGRTRRVRNSAATPSLA